MALGTDLILVAAGLVFVSILAGLLANRIGAPLLLVFMALGMLAGSDAGLGITLTNLEAASTLGAAALAIILFDGGVHTRTEMLRLAAGPALALATVGVVVTAALTGAGAVALLDVGWREGLLVGAIVASTDAAAVFFLLHRGGLNLAKRVSAALEAESGLNDPMAVFLTVTLVDIIRVGGGIGSPGALVVTLVVQLLGGLVIGLAGGFALVSLINAVRLASGLYPVFALSGALVVFAAAQGMGASGFLAVYLTGVVLGNRPHRATQLIDRFQDGIAWLSQIAMFLMLGLLVDIPTLLDILPAALGVAAVLILVARPVGVSLCLRPFGFAWRETAFISWVGLRGAVPIFLGTVPVLAGLENAPVYFNIAFVCVVASLLVQGWTLTNAARWLNLVLPPLPSETQRVDVNLPGDATRDLAAFVVPEDSDAVGHPPAAVRLDEGVTVVSVVREGRVMAPGEVGHLVPGDTVMVVGPGAALERLDAVFGRKPPSDPLGRDQAALGEFVLNGATPLGRVAELYEVPVPVAEHDLSLDRFLRRHLRGRPATGDRLRLGAVELIVRETDDRTVTRVGLELEPRPVLPIGMDALRIWRRHWTRRVFGRRRA
ncbi:potassium/proton antiporter, CPA1 family [Limimonas halophila]|uniref:Potassium/proton antiporter, CPA1 family n=1 Tax=Limimonas halophila TaxID=1082479 RepID=A0A1G7TQK7_9PROT|nr:potassium/proton antiporter [Limimonas halophila]SDG37575.1 potassium/proton antiporter, CPA1 family [Limimonas halophila]